MIIGTAYRVWDSLNSHRDEAVTIEADGPEDAAETYAEDDSAGHMDGIYQLPHPIAVEDASVVA